MTEYKTAEYKTTEYREAEGRMKNEGEDRREAFTRVLQGKKIPILTLDNKWYRLFDEETRVQVGELEEELNDLLKKQGRLNNEVKNIKRLKKKLMGEIVSLADEASSEEKEETNRKLDQNKKLVEDCNQRLEGYQDELLDLPREIEQANFRLMLATMDCCYGSMQENGEKIREIEDWVTEIRIELKKRLIRKQEMEQQNNAIYSYMHDVFGAEVIDIFDMQYVPEEEENQADSQE